MNCLDEYVKEIRLVPDSESLPFAVKFTVDMLPNMISDDIDDSINVVKRQYENIRNDMFLDAIFRLEQCLFRLYEIKYFVCIRTDKLSYAGFVFDDDYHDFVMSKIRESFDSELAVKEYEAALLCVKEKDYEKAGVHFKKAALNGHVAAQYNFGVSVSNGEVGEADSLEGAFWYFLAAKSGHKEAMVNLAIAYRNGAGVYQCGRMMLYWYAKAAYALFPYGVYNLGLSLMNEEVITGNSFIGRHLKNAADNLEDEEIRDFVLRISGQIIGILSDKLFNI